MNLRDLLSPDRVVIPVEGASLREALGHMVERLAERGLIRDAAAVRRMLADTRIRDVVALGDRVVLPHFRTDAVADLTMAVGVAQAPIPAPETGGALRPQVIVLVLAPREAATLYLQTVSTLTRTLEGHPGLIDRLVQAKDAQEVLDLPELRDARVQPRLVVRDIMSHNVWSVSPEQSAREAVDLMVRRRVAALPVVGEKGEVLGIVTDRELMSALLPQIPRAGDEAENAQKAAALRDHRIRDIMSRSVLCISEEMGLNEVATMMINKNVEQMPVVREGTLTGILTRTDIIRKLFGR